MGKGGNKPKCLVDLFFNNLKNLPQLVSALVFGQWISDSAELSLEEAVSASNPGKQASRTPVGDDPSCLSFSMSEHLRSTKDGKKNTMDVDTDHVCTLAY